MGLIFNITTDQERLHWCDTIPFLSITKANNKPLSMRDTSNILKRFSNRLWLCGGYTIIKCGKECLKSTGVRCYETISIDDNLSDYDGTESIIGILLPKQDLFSYFENKKD